MYRYLAIMLLLTLPGIAIADDHQDAQMSRGEMLYRNHCIECHNQQIHWRDGRIAADLNGLKKEVERWQDAIGVKWTEEEVNEVSRYLNSTYYFY
ncbi:MAG: hypothetical protein CVU26_03370 [Betaproteobacteria bacterium HGW-Betaproteobacteria-2]|nr:MAG: hypothetical protein CVU26_03370 [Betaproteobacteria bacterium HGW-Betaproteobacteria-2]